MPSPSNVEGDDPVVEDPSNGLESLGLETCSGDEAEAMEIDDPPASTDWRVPILEWIDRGRLPADNTEA